VDEVTDINRLFASFFTLFNSENSVIPKQDFIV
jgi:hypothetical protein